MDKFRIFWNKLIGLPATSDQAIQREQWTRDIVRIMFFVVLIASAAILLGVFLGYFFFEETLPIYIILLFTTLAYIGARNNGWRWARFLPVLICLLNGFFFSYQSYFRSSGLFYPLAIFLTGMLFGVKPSWFVAFLSFIGYSLLGSDFRFAVMFMELPSIITTFFLLLGTTFLLTYFDQSISRVITDLVNGNKKLIQEIDLREQAEVAREKQASLYTRLAENTSDLVCEMGLDGSFKYNSPSYLTILGFTPESLAGENAFDLVHPDDLPKALATEEQVRLSHQPSRVRLRVRHQDGHYIPMEVSGSPVNNMSGDIDGYILSSRDITHQVIAEETLKESEAKFRNIIEATPLGIHMYAMVDDEQLILTGYNPAADSILGINHAPLIGKKIQEAFPLLANTEVPQAYLLVAKNGGRWNKDQLNYQDEDVHGVFEIQTFQYAPGKMVSMFEDITNKIAVAEALRSSQEIFSKAFHTSPDSININRLTDGVYIDINQGFTDMTGYTRDEVIGVSSLEIEIWADPSDRAKLVKDLLNTGEVSNLEAGFRFKNGSIRTGLMSARVIEINHEKCILSITRDITERKLTEMELVLAHTQLEEAYTATLEGWVRALEIREHDTADHSRRVVELTMAMAKKMGILEEDLIHIQRGALLHDIGKIGVPDNILLKPGALTPEEWIIMRYHPVYARNLMQDIAYLMPAIDIPYCHHERWDGSGYPRGIEGEKIPLIGKNILRDRCF